MHFDLSLYIFFLLILWINLPNSLNIFKTCISFLFRVKERNLPWALIICYIGKFDDFVCTPRIALQFLCAIIFTFQSVEHFVHSNNLRVRGLKAQSIKLFWKEKKTFLTIFSRFVKKVFCLGYVNIKHQSLQWFYQISSAC